MITKSDYIMDNPLLECRKDALDKVDIKKRYIQILNILSNGSMTAKEIAVEMYRTGCSYSDDRNVTSPRLNELMNRGIVIVIGKTKCSWSGVNVSVYKINPNINIKEINL